MNYNFTTNVSRKPYWKRSDSRIMFVHGKQCVAILFWGKSNLRINIISVYGNRSKFPSWFRKWDLYSFSRWRRKFRFLYRICRDFQYLSTFFITDDRKSFLHTSSLRKRVYRLCLFIWTLTRFKSTIFVLHNSSYYLNWIYMAVHETLCQESIYSVVFPMVSNKLFIETHSWSIIPFYSNTY